MGHQTCVILLLLLHTSIGLAQDVSVHDGSTTSYLPNSHTVTPSVTLKNGLTNTDGNWSDTQKLTNNPNNVLTTVSSASQQNSSTIVSKLPNVYPAIKKNSGNATDSSSAIPMIKSNTTENFSIRTVDMIMNTIQPSREPPTTSTMTSNENRSNEIAVTGALDNVSATRAIERKSSAGEMFNELNGKMVDVIGSDVVPLTFNDIAELLNKETKPSLKSNSSDNDVINTEQIMPIGSSSLGEGSESGPGPTEVDKNALYTRDSANVSEGMETPMDAYTKAANISVDNTDMFPKLKWEPGMKQPQTISDLIKITGADIKFITSQFGSEISEKRNDINMTDPDRNKTLINVSDENNTATKNDKVSTIKDADTLIDSTIIKELEIADSKVETTLTNINELTPGTTASIIQEDGLINSKEFRSQKPQLTTIHGKKVIPVSAPNVVQRIDSSVKTNIGEVISMSPSVSKTANGFLPKGKFNTQEPVKTIVVEKQPGNLTSPRLNNLDNRKTTSRDALDLSRNGFRRNRERVAPDTRQRSIPRRLVSQADMDSRRIISFGNNPQYTIGTGNSVQIPRFIARNGLPNIESTEGSNNGQTNQGLFRRRLSGPGISEMPPGMGQSTSGEGFTVGTVTSPFLSSAIRSETRGLPSWAPPIGSMDLVRSGIFRSSVPILGDFSGSSARNTISGGQVFDGGMSVRESSGGSMPMRNGFRSASSGASFNYIPFVRGLDNRAPMTGSIRDSSAMPFGLDDIVPREVRQSADIVTRSDTSGDFSRQQIGGGISGSSVSRPSEISRTTGFRRDFLRTMDFNDRIIPRAVRFGSSIPRDGSGFSVPVRDITLTSGMFASGGFGGIRTPMFTPGRIIDTRIRPTGIFRGSIYRPLDMFAPSPAYFVRAF